MQIFYVYYYYYYYYSQVAEMLNAMLIDLKFSRTKGK